MIYSPVSTCAISVVSPCYNEAEVVREFYARTTAACRRLTDDYEIVLVDDGSTDDTWPIMVDIASRDPHVRCVALSRNHGHQLALTAGLSHSGGERILIIDADLQDPPELLPEMMKMADAGVDVVYGVRRTRAGETGFKKFAASAFYRVLNWFADREIPRDTGDFRLITRRVLDVINAMPERHRFLRGMVSWAGFRQEPLGFDRQPRFAGKTKYPMRRSVILALDAITSFSVKPLRLAFLAGVILSGISILLLGYTFLSYFAWGTVRGWTSMLAIMLFFLAAQFLFLGLIGEYLGRMYLETKNRPLFVVRDVVQFEVTEAAPRLPAK